MIHAWSHRERSTGSALVSPSPMSAAARRASTHAPRVTTTGIAYDPLHANLRGIAVSRKEVVMRRGTLFCGPD
jgi:hypothetical protein